MNKLGLSSKVDIIKPSASFAVAQKANDLKRSGRDIVDLVLGEPDFDVPAPVKEGLYHAIDSNKTHYTSSQGIIELREELAKQIGYGITPDQIMFCSGCKLGIYTSLEAIIDPGDEIIVIDPAWVSYVHMITLAHGKSVVIRTKKENKFIPTIEDIKHAISTKTKGIILNNPSNPTGQILPKEFLDEIIDLARKHNLFIISDEIYCDIVYEKEKFYSLLNYDYEKIIVTSGFSKNLAMTGLRFGYVVAHKELIKAINKLHSHIGSCAPSICQYGLLGKLQPTFAKEVEEMRQTYLKRRDILLKGLQDTIFDVIIPEATFYMLLDCSKLGMKSLDASTYILENYEVASLPGIAFGESIDDFIRLSFATSEKELYKAIDRLTKIIV